LPEIGVRNDNSTKMHQALERVSVCWRNYHSALRRNVQSIER
jgi:N-formylglutamate amidohydrolase